ncbi:TIGR02391 family protein [Mycobacteroides abscessus subsp. massiliense]|nr:TIGR02391 family protein [Mycobacteroides abscessus subsp. massiliense]
MRRMPKQRSESPERPAESPICLGPRVRIAVAGAGEFDVIDAWLTVTQPKPLFYPDDVLAVCNNVLGRLEEMIKRADAEQPFQVDVEAMNPLIWGAARKLWNDEHYREAVLAAAGALVHHVKQLTGVIEIDETKPVMRRQGEWRDRRLEIRRAWIQFAGAHVRQTLRQS